MQAEALDALSSGKPPPTSVRCDHNDGGVWSPRVPRELLTSYALRRRVADANGKFK
jgi:hypothetical protein